MRETDGRSRLERERNVKKILGIAMLTAVGMLAQGTAPANPPANPAPAVKAHQGKKHHHHKKAGTAAPATGAVAPAPAPAAGK